MNDHARYQDWLVLTDEDALPAEQDAELQSHLRTCSQCSALADAWGQVERSLQQAEMTGPQPGFHLRWQARQAETRRRAYRRQTAVALTAAVLVALVVLAVLLVLAAPWLRSPALLVWAGVYRLFSLYMLAEQAGETLLPLFGNLAGAIPLVLWVFAFGLLSELAVLWVVSYRMLTNPRRITK